MAAGIWAGFKLQGNINWKSKVTGVTNTTTVQQIIDLINYKYVDSLTNDSLELDAISAITKQLDPHSIYISPDKLAAENAQIQGNFTGIGIEYYMFNDTLTVVNVMRKGPSEKAGVKVGDQILKVEANNIAGVDVTTARLQELLRGKPGTSVNITIKRNTGTQDINITRGNIPLLSVDASYMVDSVIGYLRINKFSETTYPEFMEATNALISKGMKKMILDLRGNTGGLLVQATHIADEFIKDGKVLVTTKGNSVGEKQITSSKIGVFETGELVVLIDEFSASASEVLAGALQDHDRAIIIGRRSFGKGLVQEQYNLNNGGALRLTVARYYTPTGRSIQMPYDRGNGDKYYEDFYERLGHVDDIRDSSKIKAYKTPAGKLVYDNGGITPDIVVTVDTTKNYRILNQLSNRNVLSQTAFNIFRHSADLSKMPIQQFIQQYQFPANNWENIKQEAIKDSINITGITPQQKQDIDMQLKALLGRFMFDNNGYFQIVNQRDSIVQRAVSYLHTH